MKTKKPKTRVAADAPRSVAHLSTAEQQALELTEEVSHATGKEREDLTKKATKLSEDRAT